MLTLFYLFFFFQSYVKQVFSDENSPLKYCYKVAIEKSTGNIGTILGKTFFQLDLLILKAKRKFDCHVCVSLHLSVVQFGDSYKEKKHLSGGHFKFYLGPLCTLYFVFIYIS